MTDINNYVPADVYFARKGEAIPPDAHGYTIGEYLLKKRGIILPSIPPGEKERLRREKMENFYKQEKKEELPFPKFMKNAVFGEQFIIGAPYYGVATFLESYVRHGSYSFKFATVYVDPFNRQIDRGSIFHFVAKAGKEILMDPERGQKIIGKVNGVFDFQKMYELHAISVILSNFTDCLDRPQADVEMNGFFSHIRPEILSVLKKKSNLAKEAVERLPEKERNCSWKRQETEWESFKSVNWREELQNCGLDLSEYFQIIEKKP